MFGGPAELGHQRRGGPVVEQRSARADLFDGLGEFHALDVLDDVSAGAGQYRVQHGFVGGERRQHQAAQVRQPGQEFSAQFDAVAVRQPNIEDRDVGLKSRDPRQRLSHRPGLADDLEFGVGAEEVDQTSPDHLVVIDEEDFHHVKALRRWRDRRM